MIHHWQARLALSALGTIAIGCSSGQRPDNTDLGAASPRHPAAAPGASSTARAGAPPPRREMRVATYNAGLAVGVLKYAGERAVPLIRALAEEPLDLLCVQEMWLDEHWQKLVDDTSSTLPGTYRLPPAAPPGTCSQTEVSPLAACAESSCASLPVHEAPLCLLHHCRKELTALSSGCFDCLAANPKGSPAQIVAACVQKGAAKTSVTPGKKENASSTKRSPSPAGFRVYSGSYGTGILTNARILERDARILPSSLDSRAVLYAKLDTPIGELNAFCTHLTANLPGVPHPGGGSWKSDQSAQIDALLAFVDEKSRGRPAILLGDLNTGPAISPSIAPSLPDHYARIADHGFLDPYAAQPDASCTYCLDNPLDGGRGTHGLLIDHVMLRDFPGRAAHGSQIMRSPIQVATPRHPLSISPSDHYGVSVTLTAP